MQHKPDEWRLFIDSSKSNIKAVLEYASVPVGHSIHLNECYRNLELILNKISFPEHKWAVCGDLKVISMLLGQQSVTQNSRVFSENGTAVIEKTLYKERMANKEEIESWS